MKKIFYILIIGTLAMPLGVGAASKQAAIESPDPALKDQAMLIGDNLNGLNPCKPGRQGGFIFECIITRKLVLSALINYRTRVKQGKNRWKN